MANKVSFDALCKIQYGMYIITSKLDDRFNGQIATVVVQVTSDPIQIMTCISKNTLTHEFIKQSGILGISILEQETPMKFIGHFGFRSGRDVDKFADIKFKISDINCPLVLEHALVVMDSKVNKQVDVGSHSIFIADLLDAEIVKQGTAMTVCHEHK